MELTFKDFDSTSVKSVKVVSSLESNAYGGDVQGLVSKEEKSIHLLALEVCYWCLAMGNVIGSQGF